MNVTENFDLSALNTFGIACTARYYAEINSKHDLLNLLTSSPVTTQSMLVLGGGSNMLFTTEVLNKLVLKINIKGIKIIEENNESALIWSGAGEVWDDLVAFAVDNDLYGIENLSHIPGLVGAAPIQNIGAYGAEVKDTIEYVEYLELETLLTKTITKSECQFAYRSSIFKSDLKNKIVITGVAFRLKKHDTLKTQYAGVEDWFVNNNAELNLKNIRRAIISIRDSKLPDYKVTGNAGSFFKNPEVEKPFADELKKLYPEMPTYPTNNGVKIAAGWLIEKAGYKGVVRGRAGTHPKHALALINLGQATGSEIINLAHEIINEVSQKFDLTLEPEVNIIGG